MDKIVRKAKYEGTVIAPPSKSRGHRLLICAALADGKSVIHGISDSEDMKATLDCIESLGARYEKDGDTVTVWGADPSKREKEVFKCRESGSTLRFFIPLAMLSERTATFKGSKTLMSRPLDTYEDIAVSQGLDFMRDEERLELKGPIRSGYFKIPGDISSQFVTGLMLALPLTEGYNVIELIPPICSAPYIKMTAKALSDFGIRVSLTEENTIVVPGGQRYKPGEFFVEGDWSNAAFFMALEALGQDVFVEGLDKGSCQGDSVIRLLIPRLCKGRASIDIEQCPDLAPILMALGAAMNGVYLTGTGRLKLKESNRAEAMATELRKFGAEVTVTDDTVSVISPKELVPPAEKICGHNDHRIVMANAILLTKVGGIIEGAEAVSKSYPDFFDDLYALETEN